MDMSFADQALSCEYVVKNHASLENKVYTVPVDLDKRVAKLKLESLGIKIDRLTSEQEEYLASWSEERRAGSGVRFLGGVSRFCCFLGIRFQGHDLKTGAISSAHL